MSATDYQNAKDAYKNAVNEFSEVSVVMQRHVIDGTKPTQAEIHRYSRAHAALDSARRAYISIWRYRL
jgi:hypothetical protein